MDNNHKHAFLNLMTQAGLYYGKRVPKEMIILYWRDLCTYTLEEVERAFDTQRRCEKMGKYFPKINDLLSILKVVRGVQSSGKCTNRPFGSSCLNRAMVDVGTSLGFVGRSSDPKPFLVCEQCYQMLFKERDENVAIWRAIRADGKELTGTPAEMLGLKEREP